MALRKKEIVALRRFPVHREGQGALRALPYGLEGDREDPTRARPPARSGRSATGILGYNAAEAYDFDPVFRSQSHQLRRTLAS